MTTHDSENFVKISKLFSKTPKKEEANPCCYVVFVPCLSEDTAKQLLSIKRNSYAERISV